MNKMASIVPMLTALWILSGCMSLPIVQPDPTYDEWLRTKPIHEQIPFMNGEWYSEGVYRYRITNVNIEGQGRILTTNRGGVYKVTMDILVDCTNTGETMNQIIVGLGDEDQAQVCVWNGQQRSGGKLWGVEGEPVYEHNTDKAEWRKVYFTIRIPDEASIYYIRSRYAQAFTGNVMTEEGLKIQQIVYPEPLKWWKVDRPNGPEMRANIGAIVVDKYLNMRDDYPYEYLE